MFPLKLFLIFFFLFFFEIDHITLDPDPNWTKIQDPDPKFICNVSTTLGCRTAERCGSTCSATGRRSTGVESAGQPSHHLSTCTDIQSGGQNRGFSHA